jgi:ribosomal protein S7
VERLYEILGLLREEYRELKLQSLMDRLMAAMDASINSPSPESFKQLSDIRSEVSEALDKSRFNSVPTTLMLELEEISVWEWTGSRIKADIEEIFSRNAITLTTARDELSHIVDTLKEDIKNTSSLYDSLEYFRFEKEGLSPGEFELGVVIPRSAVDNEINLLGSEFIKINKILGVFAEIYAGSRDNFKIRSLSTSDPTVFLESTPAVAAAIAVAIERAVALYGQVLAIRKSHQELSKNKLPKKVLDGINEHIEKTIKDGLKDHAERIRKEAFSRVEVGRQNELMNELNNALWALAKRLDEGYLFDVRGRPEESPEDAEPTAKTAAALEHLRQIERANQAIQSFRAEPTPVLRLPDQSRDAEGDDSTS